MEHDSAMNAVQQARPQPDYSVIVPAYNEAQFLPATLNALRAAMAAQAARGEVIVVDNNSTDRTAEVAQLHGARVVFEAHNQISRARNRGAAGARAPHLVFVDADTLISAELLGRALAALADATICGGGARIATVRTGAVADLALAAWNGIATRLRLAAGCFLFCRREAFDAAGGFSEAVYASEEIWLSRDLGHWGRAHAQRFVILNTAAMTSARKLEWLSPWQIFAQLAVLIVLFPLAVRSRRLCASWYRRPAPAAGCGPAETCLQSPAADGTTGAAASRAGRQRAAQNSRAR